MRIIKLTKVNLHETSIEVITRVNVKYISRYHLYTLNSKISLTEIKIEGSWMKVKETPEEIDELIKNGYESRD